MDSVDWLYKKKQSSYHASFTVRKYISETATAASSLCKSKESITGQRLCLTSLLMFSTHTTFLQLRQRVPEALPPQSLLSVYLIEGSLSLLFEIRRIKQNNSVKAVCAVFVV